MITTKLVSLFFLFCRNLKPKRCLINVLEIQNLFFVLVFNSFLSSMIDPGILKFVIKLAFHLHHGNTLIIRERTRTVATDAVDK